MLKKIIEWLRCLWRDTDQYAEDLVNDDAEYMKNKYGINRKYADD
jgi:hypothetical protein